MLSKADETESNADRSSKRNAYAVAALLVAILLILALGDWPSGYYQVLRVVTFGFSIAVAYREVRSEGRGWLIFAVAAIIIFNPVFQINLDKGNWDFIDLVFAAGYAAYGLVSATKALASAATPLIWIAFAATMGLTYYVNNYMPHGPSVPTGDIVCMNDGRGPCGDELREDLSGLDIPAWAMFLRQYFGLFFISLPVAAIFCHYKPDDPYERIEERSTE